MDIDENARAVRCLEASDIVGLATLRNIEAMMCEYA